MAETTIAGMVATGRRLAGPGVELRELQAPNGLKHLAYVHHETLRTHPALGILLQGRLAFMEQPDVGGLVRLVAHDPSTATFVYPTGTMWTVAEVVRQLADNGEAAGVKAGLELCYLVAESLVEAAEAGSGQGVPSHGNVNPWTVGIKADGQPVVLLYGVPQVELLAWRDNPKRGLTEDAWRYLPPERAEAEAEDVSSDLLSLALVSLELMVGRPVYDGVVADVRQQASRGEGVRRLYQWREKLPQNVREVMSRALKPDPDTRFPNGMEFVYAVHDLLGSIDVEGPSLAEVMVKVRSTERRQKSAGTRTGAMTAEELKELAADLEDLDSRPLPPPRRPRIDDAVVEEPKEKPRWSRSTRSPEAPAPAAPPAAPPRPALVRSGIDREPSLPGDADRPRRRLRNDGSVTGTQTRATPRTEPPPTAAPIPAAPATSDERERLRRRLRDPVAPTVAPIPPSELSTGPLEPMSPVGLDLSGPDDVSLEPITGAPSESDPVTPPPPELPVPPPPEPRVVPQAPPAPAAPERPTRPAVARDEPLLEDSTAERSAAAALLERLGGGRRRRTRLPAEEPAAEPSSPAAEEVAAPTPVPPAPPATPAQVASAAPVTPTPVARCTVTDGPREVAPVLGDGERAGALAWRAALELGALPLDWSGRLVGRPALSSEGRVLGDAETVTPGARYALVTVDAGHRTVELTIDGEPSVSFRAQVALAMPVAWLLRSVGDAFGFAVGERVLVVDGAPADPGVCLSEALGDAARASLARR